MVAAFLYGTLMHPEILKRVIGNNGLHLRICAAILKDFTRHEVKGEDYPAIVPYALSRSMFDRDLEPEERTVRGTLVSGLTDEDIRLLDVYEEDEYTRELVSAYPLGALVGLHDGPPMDVNSILSPKMLASVAMQQPVEVDAYIWCMPLSMLRPDCWTFESFIRHNAWKWVGAGYGETHDYYREVDRQNAMRDILVQA